MRPPVARALSFTALFVLAVAGSLHAQVVTGTYTGDGSGSRSVTGLGFTPELVIIKLDDVSVSGVARTSTMGGGSKAIWGNTGLQANQIASLDTGGFTVGSDIAVNGLNACGAGSDPCIYYWTAFNADSNIVVGSYTGDGSATQAITGVGFAVDYVMILGEGVRWARNRWDFASSTPLGAGANFRFRNSGENSTSIPSLDANGFTVGDGSSGQDDANESGVTYHYVAFNEQSGAIKMGSYPGDGSSPRDVTGVGFQPIYVIVQSLDDGDQAIQKSDRMPASDSLDFINGLLNNRIVGLIADGFQVSNDTRVNGGGEDYTYVAFSGAAGAGRPVYYSVGTSGTADLSSGSPTVTISSGTATFSAPQPANVGQGDEITYNGANKVYISGRTSAYVYSVTTATGLVPSDVAGATVDTIHRAFDSLSAAQTGSSDASHLNTADLEGAGVQLNWVCYNDGPMNDMVDIAGWTTGAATYLRIFTPVTSSEVGITQRHYGVQGTGFRLTPASAVQNPYDVIHVRTGFVRIEGIEIDGSGLTNAEYVRGILILKNMSNVGEIRIDSNIIHDLYSSAAAYAFESSVGILDLQEMTDTGPPMYVSNNFIYDIYSNRDAGHLAGILIGSRTTSYVYNNTVYNIFNEGGAGGGPAWGIYAKAWPGGTGNATVFATNNYCGDVRAPQDPVSDCYDARDNGILNQSNNVASDTTASGAGSVDNQTAYASYFVNVTPGSENLHLLTDSSVWGTNGTPLDGDPNLPVTDDIDGEPRHPTIPDIGADQAVVTTNFRSIGTAPNYLTGTIDVTAGSPVVTGTSTAWVSANRGRGDRIAFNLEEYTVLSVDSQTQITLTTPVASTFVGGYTLYRQFSTLEAWETCISGGGGCTYFPVASSDLVADGRAEVGIAYNDSVVPSAADFTANLVFDGATTDASHNITLTADHGNRHYGVPGDGVLYDCSACPDTDDEIQILDVDHVTIEWLEVTGVNGSAGDGGIKVRTVQNALLQYLLVHDNRNGIRLSDSAGKSLTVRNSIVYNNSDIGIEGDEVGDVLVVENSTVFGHGLSGIHGQSSTATVTVRNTISMNNTIDFASVGTHENNISEDGTAACGSCLPNRDPTGSASPGAPPQGNGWVMFVNVNPGNENFHLRDNVALNNAQNNAQDLSATFDRNVDAGVRVSPWDVGADDAAAATAVELIAFGAAPLDGAVELTWETASELDNLGFHLYRSTTRDGEYERITASIIPGLGSSPAGARYRYRDDALTNGVVYYYELEDIETSGVTERHGPVAAAPRAGLGPRPSDDDATGDDGPGERSSLTYGDPSANRFEVLSWDDNGAVVELRTEGFFAAAADDGSVVVTAPGLEAFGREGAVAIPVARPWIEAVAGVGVEIVGVEEADVEVFSSLRPLDPGSFGLVATTNGVVRADARGRRRRTKRDRDRAPARPARVLGTSFHGESKRVQLELAPFGWSPNRSELRLTRRLIVRLVFSGRAKDEPAPRRRYRSRGAQDVIARLATTSPGLHVVHYRELFGASRRAHLVDTMSVERLGTPVPFHVEPDARSFGPGSTLYFSSVGPDASPYGHEVVYEVRWSRNGITMATASASPTGGEVSTYWRTAVEEHEQYYQPALLEAPDRWLWDALLGGSTRTYSVEIDGLAPSADSGRLSVWLQGASDLATMEDHHVRVSVNGAFVGEATWDGKRPQRIDAEILPGVLVSGTNTIAIENAGDTDAAYSMVFLDRFEIETPHALSVASGELTGSFRAAGTATVSGLGAGTRVVDVTDSDAPRWMDELRVDVGARTVSFRVESGRTYVAVSPESVQSPEVRRPSRPRLRDARMGADYLLIGPASFLESAKPLLQHRRREGLRTLAVSFEQIVEEFGYGEARPEAIRDFLEYTLDEWKAPAPKYVLLLGDATYDYKDFMQTGVLNQLPALMVETTFLWTASDPTLVMLRGDDSIPDMAIGRLPAKDVGELEIMIAKILAFERGDATLFDHAMVLVADDPDRAGDFEADADEIAATLLPRERVEKIYLGVLGAPATRDAIVGALDRGASLVSYMGHGGINLWADENVFNLDDVDTLASQSRQPMFITMNCLNGYFHFPYFDSLAEGVLKAEGRGAIAAFSPTGLSLNTPAHRFHKTLLRSLARRENVRLGDAVLAAQREYGESGAFPELLAIYHLLGDPALRLR